MRIETDEYIVTFADSAEVKDAVFTRLIEYFKKHEAFSGESICQSDGPTVDAINVLSDIADDIITFDVNWIE